MSSSSEHKYTAILWNFVKNVSRYPVPSYSCSLMREHVTSGPVRLTAVFGITSDGKAVHISRDSMTGATGGRVPGFTREAHWPTLHRCEERRFHRRGCQWGPAPHPCRITLAAEPADWICAPRAQVAKDRCADGAADTARDELNASPGCAGILFESRNEIRIGWYAIYAEAGPARPMAAPVYLATPTFKPTSTGCSSTHRTRGDDLPIEKWEKC